MGIEFRSRCMQRIVQCFSQVQGHLAGIRSCDIAFEGAKVSLNNSFLAIIVVSTSLPSTRHIKLNLSKLATCKKQFHLRISRNNIRYNILDNWRGIQIYLIWSICLVYNKRVEETKYSAISDQIQGQFCKLFVIFKEIHPKQFWLTVSRIVANDHYDTHYNLLFVLFSA